MTTITELIARKARMEDAIKAITAALRDIDTAKREGLDNAGYAAAWAAVLLATDICKVALSTNKVAAAGFTVLDKSIEKANKVLKMFGLSTIATKSDLMRSLDPNLQPAAAFLGDVQLARDLLSQQKIKAPKHLDFILDLSIGMAQDTILLLQTGQLQQQVARHSSNAALQSRVHLANVKEKLRRLDEQLVRLTEQAQVLERTA